MRPSDIMTVPTQEQKQEAASARLRTHLRKMEEAHNVGLSGTYTDMMKMEIDGGNCPKCNKPWLEIDYDGLFGMGRYFEPECYCFPTCRCGPEWHPVKHLYREWAADQLVKIVPKGKYLSHGRVIEITRSKVTQCPSCDGILEVIDSVAEKRIEDGHGKKKRR